MTMKSLALALCLLGGVAHAQDNRAVAREHYLKGTKAFDLGFYEDAVREYMEAYRIKDDPALLYNIAQANRLAGHTAEALRFYRVYLSKLPKDTSHEDVKAKIAELQKAIEQQNKTQNGLPPDQPIRPAPSIAEPVVVTPPRAPEASPPRPVVVEEAARPVIIDAAPSIPPPPSHAGRAKRWAGIAVGSTGVAFVVAGVAFGVLAKSAGDELTRADRAMQPFDANRESAGKTFQTLEGVFLGLGAVAAVTGIVLYVLGHRDAKAHGPLREAQGGLQWFARAPIAGFRW